MMKQLLPLLCVLTAGWASPVESPQRHMLLSVVPTTQHQLELLKTAADTDHELDFWTAPKLNDYTDVMVPAIRFVELRRKWTSAGMQVRITQQDVEAHIRNVLAEDRRLMGQRVRPRADTTLDHNKYRSYEEFVDDINRLRIQFPNLVRFDDSGESFPLPRTVEGRIFHYFEVGANPDAPVIFLEVMIHAREWITGAANFYAIDWLVTNYGKDEKASSLLDNFLFVVIPVANPDGYEYTRIDSDKRLWRKNRREVEASFNCYGVDLNRNFNAFWLGSATCTSNTYPGPTYHSEPETQAVEAVFRKYEQDTVVYLAVHCYGQVILLPWTYLQTTTPVNPYHKTVGEAMAKAMAEVYGNNYIAGTLTEMLNYTAAGSSADWALAQKVEGDGASDRSFLSIAYELRPARGTSNGFVLPASQIIPAGEEYLASLVELARQYVAEQGK